MSEEKPRRVLFRVVKGLIYGNVLGLLFATALYLLASAVSAIAPLPITPTIIAAIMYGASVTAGVAVEYSNWLEGQE
jgi:hypothetical protein